MEEGDEVHLGGDRGLKSTIFPKITPPKPHQPPGGILPRSRNETGRRFLMGGEHDVLVAVTGIVGAVDVPARGVERGGDGPHPTSILAGLSDPFVARRHLERQGDHSSGGVGLPRHHDIIAHAIARNVADGGAEHRVAPIVEIPVLPAELREGMRAARSAPAHGHQQRHGGSLLHQQHRVHGGGADHPVDLGLGGQHGPGPLATRAGSAQPLAQRPLRLRDRHRHPPGIRAEDRCHIAPAGVGNGANHHQLGARPLNYLDGLVRPYERRIPKGVQDPEG